MVWDWQLSYNRCFQFIVAFRALNAQCLYGIILYYLELHSDYQNHLRCRGGGLVQVQILKVFCMFFFVCLLSVNITVRRDVSGECTCDKYFDQICQIWEI